MRDSSFVRNSSGVGEGCASRAAHVMAVDNRNKREIRVRGIFMAYFPSLSTERLAPTLPATADARFLHRGTKPSRHFEIARRRSAAIAALRSLRMWYCCMAAVLTPVVT